MKSILYCIFLLHLFSCDRTAFKDLHPALIKISEVEVQFPNTASENTHAIKDLWVYLDEVYLGTYPIPADIPLLDEGPHKQIRIYPGIREYGIRSKPEIYALLDPMTITSDLQPGIELNLNPVFKYKSGIKIILIEDFESGNVFTSDLDSDKLNHLNRTTEIKLEGQYAGLLFNDDMHPLAEAGTAWFTLPPSAYFELSFKASHDFNIGLNILRGSVQSKNYFLVLKASSSWKRVYIPFREVIDQNPADMYQLIFKSEYRISVAKTATLVNIDKLKIISTL